MSLSQGFSLAVAAFVAAETGVDPARIKVIRWEEETGTDSVTCSCFYAWTTVRIAYTQDDSFEEGITYTGTFKELLDDLLNYDVGYESHVVGG